MKKKSKIQSYPCRYHEDF